MITNISSISSSISSTITNKIYADRVPHNVLKIINKSYQEADIVPGDVIASGLVEHQENYSHCMAEIKTKNLDAGKYVTSLKKVVSKEDSEEFRVGDIYKEEYPNKNIDLENDFSDLATSLFKSNHNMNVPTLSVEQGEESIRQFDMAAHDGTLVLNKDVNLQDVEGYKEFVAEVGKDMDLSSLGDLNALEHFVSSTGGIGELALGIAVEHKLVLVVGLMQLSPFIVPLLQENGCIGFVRSMKDHVTHIYLKGLVYGVKTYFVEHKQKIFFVSVAMAMYAYGSNPSVAQATKTIIEIKPEDRPYSFIPHFGKEFDESFRKKITLAGACAFNLAWAGSYILTAITRGLVPGSQPLMDGVFAALTKWSADMKKSNAIENDKDGEHEQ